MTSKLPLERKLEQKCVKYAEAFSFESIKLDSAKRKWPDRLFLGPGGTTILVEFKRTGKRPRPQQAAFHKTLNALGHPVHVIDDFDDFARLIY